jgi:predicted ABC-type sugar transport system permease subunit
MDWDEQLRGIKLKTLFKLGGKLLLASIPWLVVLFVIVMLLMYAFARFTTLW